MKLFDPGRVKTAFENLGKQQVYLDIQALPKLVDLARRPVLLDLIARYERRFTPSSKLKDLYEDTIRDMLSSGTSQRRATRRDFANELALLIQNSDSGAMPHDRVQSDFRSAGQCDLSKRGIGSADAAFLA